MSRSDGVIKPGVLTRVLTPGTMNRGFAMKCAGIFQLIVGILGWAFVLGCASQSERLNKEFELLSAQIEALQNEQKAIVNTEQAAQNYLKTKKEYEERRGQLEQIRKENRQQGFPIGPEVVNDMTLEETLQTLQKNQDIVSDLVRELEKKRNQVIKEQAALEARP